MRTLKITVLFFLLSASLVAQEKPKKDSISEGWKSKGLTQLLFNQSAFNEDWQGGGTSNVAGSFNITHDLNYKSKKSIGIQNSLPI